MVPTYPTTSHKAWVAAVAATLTTLVATLQGRTELGSMTLLDWVIVVASAAISGLTVWAVPNQPKADVFPDWEHGDGEDEPL